MTMTAINTAAHDIIRAYNLTARSSLATIRNAIDAYCDNPDTTRTDKLRISTRIDDTLAPLG